MTITAPHDPTAKRNVILLIIIQATIGCLIPVHFTLGGIAGKMIAPVPLLATLPISMTIIGGMIATPIITRITLSHGRQLSFFIGTMIATLGALIAAYAVFKSNFIGLNIGAFMLGFYMSSQGLFRFAATDMASENFKSRALSFALLGGVGAAFLGPTIAGKYATPNLWLPYLIISVIALVLSVLYFALRLPKPNKIKAAKIDLKPILRNPKVQAAMILSIASYAMMNFMMTSTPLAVEGCGFSRQNAAEVVRAHVLAMFLPSFFTGYLIKYFGVNKVVFSGLIILIFAAIFALTGTTLSHFYTALILLGIGWNFGFIGGTSMLASSLSDPNAAKQLQGLNDTIMWSIVAVASLSSGFFMNYLGDGGALGWRYVNIAILVILIFSMGLGYYKLRQVRA